MFLLKICQKNAALKDKVVLHYFADNQVETLTYRELLHKAQAIASVLLNRGYQNSQCLLALDNPVEQLISLLGCLYAEVTPVIFPYDSTQVAHNQIIRLAKLSQIRTILSQHRSGDIKNVSWIKASKAMKQVPLADLKIPAKTEQEALLYEFTPNEKASFIRLNFASLRYNCNNLVERLNIENFQGGLACHLPFHNPMGFSFGFLLPFIVDAPVWILSPKELQENPVSFLKVLSIKSLSAATLSGDLMSACVEQVTSDDIKELDLCHWKIALNTEFWLKQEVVERFKERFFPTGFEASSLYPCYSRKETGFIATSRMQGSPSHKLYLNKHEMCKGYAEVIPMSHQESVGILSKGPAINGYEVKIMRNGEEACKPYEIGEIWIESHYLSAGYYQNEMLNQKYFHESTEGKPVLKTGHLGFVDNSLDLFVTGEVKDITHINGNFINLKEFKQELLNSCKEIKADGLVLFNNTVDDQQEHLVILLETDLNGNKLSQLYDKIIDVACRDIELNFIFIAVFPLLSLPREEQLLDEDLTIAQWKNKVLVTENYWQLPVSTIDSAHRMSIINVEGLSDKRKAEKLSTWLYAWIALKTGIAEAELDISKHLAFYGFNFIDVIQLAHEVKLVFNQWLNPATVWEFTNLKALARFAFSEAFLDEHLPEITAYADNDYFHGSSANEQSIHYLANHHTQDSSLYLLHSFAIKGAVDIDAMQRALQAVCNKHANLRTGYKYKEKQLQRFIFPQHSCHFEEVDLSGLTPAEQQPMIYSMLQQLEMERFVELASPMWRVVAYKLSHDRYHIALVLHKLLADYWSCQIILRDLTQCYNTEINGHPSLLEEEKFLYADFAAWQNNCISNEHFLSQNFYWENRLENVQPLYLPYDNQPTEAAATEASYLYFSIEKDMLALLKTLAASNEVDLYTLFLSSVQMLLHWFTKEHNITIKCNQANRHYQQFFHTVGNFESNVLIQENIHPRSSVTDLLLLNRESLIRSCSNMDLPFSEILKCLSAANSQNMPNVAFECHYFPQPLHFENLSVTQRNFDFLYPNMVNDPVHLLFAFFIAKEHVDVRMHYRARFFHEETASLLLQKYTAILTALIEDVHMPIQHIIQHYYAKQGR